MYWVEDPKKYRNKLKQTGWAQYILGPDRVKIRRMSRHKLWERYEAKYNNWHCLIPHVPVWICLAKHLQWKNEKKKRRKRKKEWLVNLSPIPTLDCWLIKQRSRYTNACKSNAAQRDKKIQGKMFLLLCNLVSFYYFILPYDSF